jgi:hypothetical protein
MKYFLLVNNYKHVHGEIFEIVLDKFNIYEKSLLK